ncbi:hypothetical protein X801_07549, partial [Opisthorchis viverrini]
MKENSVGQQRAFSRSLMCPTLERCWRFDVQNMLRLIYNRTPNSGGDIRYPTDPDLGPDFRCVQRVPPDHGEATILVLTDSMLRWERV